jgi:hypothetical protein
MALRVSFVICHLSVVCRSIRLVLASKTIYLTIQNQTIIKVEILPYPSQKNAYPTGK